MSRVVIHPADRAEIQAQHPDRDIEAIHSRFSDWSEKREVFAPRKAFESWVERAERENTDRIGESEQDKPRGMFKADGSWDERGFGDREAHRFVDMLVNARRRDYPPWRVAERILREPERAGAFPNAVTWAGISEWPLCPCATSAEQCVKDAGRGPQLKPDGERSDGGYAAFRLALIARVVGERLTPAQVADELAKHFDAFALLPGLGELLDAEIISYRAKGDRW